jgi:hypothetical protein
MRGFLASIFVLVVLTLGALEVVATHSVRETEPMRAASAQPLWCSR